MSDRQLIRLNAKWALAYDPAQWIVQRRSHPAKGGQPAGWSGVSFIGSNKDILWRCLDERGIDVTPEARAYIDAMPFTFKEWIALPPARRLGVLGVPFPDAVAA